MASFAGDPVQRIAAGIKQAAISNASATRIAALLDPEAAAPRALAMPLGPLRVPGLDITVQPGEMLGIVTTDPAAADALIGRMPADRRVLAEPHTVHIFGRTLHEALDTGRGSDPAVTARALAAAHAADVRGPLLDGGANLSGGQRQRVALARALVARPAVLVLRDPLTAVDAVTEDAVAEGLAALRREDDGATVLISTSPPLLTRCDRVVFLPAARPPVVATHAQLVHDADYAEAVLR
ncbi:ATP-binding cassette domain-containing protein [Dactylosporangium sp. NBC_01737]|uniref:ATP-binding cassette domain-containing protein n=1 Tax=Dactylosporangium sp. NBC_01737 TaxID=2975959 RepID=UPI002E0DEE01|nr:ATP-binding cassette domain-containing protein [Dactylosporangium sp. NBC_01737]